MSAALIHKGKAVEGVPNWIQGRVCAITATGAVSPREVEGRLVKRADILSIKLRAYDEDRVLIDSEQTLDKTVVIYETLQTSEVWKRLKGGGNFRYQVPAVLWPIGGVTERLELIILLNDGSTCIGLWEVEVLEAEQF